MGITTYCSGGLPEGCWQLGRFIIWQWGPELKNTAGDFPSRPPWAAVQVELHQTEGTGGVHCWPPMVGGGLDVRQRKGAAWAILGTSKEKKTSTSVRAEVLFSGPGGSGPTHPPPRLRFGGEGWRRVGHKGRWGGPTLSGPVGGGNPPSCAVARSGGPISGPAQSAGLNFFAPKIGRNVLALRAQNRLCPLFLTQQGGADQNW